MRRLPHRNAILGREIAPEEPRSSMAAASPNRPAMLASARTILSLRRIEAGMTAFR
jgi:hypothetical protein